MRAITRSAVIALIILVPVVTISQSASSRPATYITKEEIDIVNRQPGVDRQIRVVDIGSENFAVGIIHRGPTGQPASRAGGGGGAARGTTPAPEPCGERAATPPPTGTPRGLHHDQQTEGYYIVSGAGTLVTGGHIVNGARSAPGAPVTTELNGPSCSGFVMGSDVVMQAVKTGDIIIIPAGTPHGWAEIPDHVDYLSFRPSARVLTAGYVHPSIKK